jgi:hypothetical protein
MSPFGLSGSSKAPEHPRGSPRPAWKKNCPVFFISTICLRACRVLIHTKQRRTP